MWLMEIGLGGGNNMRTGPKFIPLSVRLDRLSIPEPNSGCWLWMGTVNGAGYGGIGRGGREGGWIGAHVAAWECAHGEVPKGLHVCHHCDNKLCVNPAHLYVATTQKNTADAKARGRFKRGTARRNARFTDDDVRDIRDLSSMGVSYNALGREYGVDHAHIRMIATGKIWAHVT